MEAWAKHLEELKSGEAVAAGRSSAEQLTKSGITDEEREAILNLKNHLIALAQRMDISQGSLGSRLELVGKEIETLIAKLQTSSPTQPSSDSPDDAQ